MPAELWNAAAATAAQLGVSRVATALGLGYGPLKARVEASSREHKPLAFVELAGSQLLAAPPSTALKLELSRGEVRLTVTAPVASAVELAALVTAFVRA